MKTKKAKKYKGEIASDAPPTEKKLQSFILALIASSFTVEAIDKVQGSRLYRQAVKNKGESFMTEIEILLRSEPELWDVAGMEVTLLVDYVRQIADRMSKMLPESMAVVLAFIEKYETEPVSCEEFLQVSITDNIELVMSSENQ